MRTLSSLSAARRALALCAVIMLALVSVLLVSRSASAHDQVVSQTPPANSTVTDVIVTEVSITFSEPPLAIGDARIAIDVDGPGGVSVATGDVRVSGATISRSIAPVAPGSYTVYFQSVSEDGHLTNGTFSFNWTGGHAPGGAPATIIPTAAAPASDEPVITTASTPVANDSSPAADVGTLVGAIVGVLVVAGLVAVIIITTLRRRQDPPTGDGEPRG